MLNIQVCRIVECPGKFSTSSSYHTRLSNNLFTQVRPCSVSTENLIENLPLVPSHHLAFGLAETMFNVPAGLGTFHGVTSDVPNKREHLFPMAIYFYLIPDSANCSLNRTLATDPYTLAATSLFAELSPTPFHPQEGQSIA
jgi:hypothetical protein